MALNLDGIMITLIDWRGEEESGLLLVDTQNGDISQTPPGKYPLATLQSLYAELEVLSKGQKLTMNSAKPIFKKYGLNK